MSNAAPSRRATLGDTGRRFALAVAIAASVVVIGGWTARSASHPAPVTVLRGTADIVDDSGTNIGFHGRKVSGPALHVGAVYGSWDVAGASWFDGRTWHDSGIPACLGGGPAQPVELGVVEAAPNGDAPGRAVVVWLRCSGSP